MTDKLKQTIQEEVMKLPKDRQDAVKSFDWVSKTEEIGKKFLLLENEINDLQVETLLVLVGLEDGSYFSQNIENEVGTSKEEADKIAEEILQKVFAPIGDKMIENIKNSEKIKRADLGQNLDFILSGGDYSAFAEKSTPQEGNKI